MQRTTLVRIAALGTLLFAATVWAADRVVVADFSAVSGPAGIPGGWQLKEKSGKADFTIIKDGDVQALRLRSANTSFSFQKKVTVEPKQFPLLRWQWKVTKLPAGGDFRRSKTDDQAAQIILAFSPTKAIVYLWDTTAPQGLMDDMPSPPFMSVKAVVVRSGPADAGKWITETRNVYEDYQKLFGSEPPAIDGMRLQINSQHTGTSAESFFAEVAFERTSTK